MARFIIYVLLFLLLYTILRYLIKGILTQSKKLNRGFEPEELIQDPYCQTYIPKRTAVRKRVGGRDYYFCNKDCLRRFLEKKGS